MWGVPHTTLSSIRDSLLARFTLPLHAESSCIMAVSQKNLYSTGAKQVSTETLKSIEVHLNRAIEVVWLTAAFLVPLIVLSEHDFYSFTELPKITLMRSLAGTGFILWLMAVAVGIAKNTLPGATESSVRAFSLRKWGRSHPIELAAALVLLVTAISAALSIQPNVSAFGADWGRDGYDLHTTASYITLFFLAATRIKNHGQLVRLWITISVAGLFAALIGISQHFALSPFGISGTYQHQRVTGTVGNPLFLGSLLTITLPMGAALALAGATSTLRWMGTPRVWWGVLALVVFIHIYAALLTASRGPWLGLIAGLIVLIALSLKTLGPKNAALATVSVSAGVGFALFIVFGPASAGIESFAISEQQEFIEELEADGIQSTVSGSAPSSASFVISQRGDQGTIETRLKIWRATQELVTDRPSLPESNNAPWFVRQVFGYGPDTFRFTFPTKASGELMGTLTSSAHNDFLNRLVEIGLAGVLAYVSLLFAAGFVIWKLMTRVQGQYTMLMALLAVGAGAAIAGRMVEQVSGVAQVSDTATIWMALAMLAAAYSLVFRMQRQPEGHSSDQAAKPVANNGWSVPSIPPAFAFSVIAIGIVLAGYLVWAHNINLIRSDLAFHKGEVLLSQDVDLALRHMERAAELNPGVEDYRHVRADILQARAEQNVGFINRAEWLQEAYDTEARAYSFNPASRAANFELAFASWQLAQLGDDGKAVETLHTYERLSELAPNHPLVIERLAQLKLAVGADVIR